MAPSSPALRAPTAPDRSLEQRLDALLRANEIRSYRAQMKKDLKGRRLRVSDVLLAAADDERLATMHIFDLLLAVPKVGRVKASKVLAQHRISPSKTLGGLSVRQRHDLHAVLRTY